MNRYKATFSRLKKEKRIGFCPFAVLGDPTPSLCMERLKKYLLIRPDFLELGIPFSDPVADGPVIEAADQRALKEGTTPKKALSLIKKIRALSVAQNQPNMPIGILTYSNILIRYGINKFYKDLSSSGADSILVADVPLEEIKPFLSAAKKNSIHQIFIVSENTDEKRLKMFEKSASGFYYVVSTLGVTGTRKKLNPNIKKFLKKLNTKTDLPFMVGFGISSAEHIKNLQNSGTSGAIVGSLLVKTPLENLTKELKILRRACQ